MKRSNHDCRNVQFEIIRDHITDRSLAIVGLKDNEPKELCGSGICMTIGGRYFIATAAHVISDYHHESLYLLHTRVPDNKRLPILRKITAGGKQNEDLDLGLLEVPEGTARRLRKQFISLPRLLPFTNFVDGESVVLHGYPLQLIQRELLDKQHLALRALTVISNTLETQEWPAGYAINRDIFVAYPRKGTLSSNLDSLDMPRAPGISGGGIWAANVSESGVWSAEKTRLMGLTTHWKRDESWVKGIQIQYWLRMVQDNYSGLAHEIRQFLGT